ncbi:hypothetical protein GCM10028806_18710 [Spirosoma terrae]
MIAGVEANVDIIIGVATGWTCTVAHKGVVVTSDIALTGISTKESVAYSRSICLS